MSAYSLGVEEYRHPMEMWVRLGTFSLVIATILVAAYFFLVPTLIVVIYVVFNIFMWYVGFISKMAMNVLVGPNQFPEIYRLAAESAQRLDMQLPRVCIEQTPILDAYAMGFSKHFTNTLSTGLINALTDKELQYVIGHEMGHCKGNHMLTRLLVSFGSDNPIFDFLLAPVKYYFIYVLLFLCRYQEYSCDRAGLIACGSIYHAVTANLKLMLGKEMFEQVNFKEFLKQIEEYQGRGKIGALQELQATHPFTVNRILRVVQFYKSPEYEAIMAKLGESRSTVQQDRQQVTMQLLHNIVDRQQVASANTNYVPQPDSNKVSGNPVLCGLEGYYAGSEIPLGGEPLSMGRNAQVCQVVFPPESGKLSRVHCILSYDSSLGKFILEDRSTTGTFLASGERLASGSRRVLNPGDRFYLVDTSNMFEVKV